MQLAQDINSWSFYNTTIIKVLKKEVQNEGMYNE